MKHKSKFLFYNEAADGIAILLGKRVQGSEIYWWIPGGSVEENEKIFDAGLREVGEELHPSDAIRQALALIVQSGMVPHSIQYSTPNSINHVFFIALADREIPGIKEEFEEMKWFDLSKLPDNMSREQVHLQPYLRHEFFSGI